MKSCNANHPHCRSRKYCPALIVMLNQCMGYKAKPIAEVTGYRINAVQNVLIKRGLVAPTERVSKSKFDIDKIEYEYVILGMSSYELEKKYRVGRSTICRWMRQRGICLGKGNHQKQENHYQPKTSECNMDGLKTSNSKRHEESEKRFAKELKEKTDGRFEYVSDYRRGIAKMRCCKCGNVFLHSTYIVSGVVCRKCLDEKKKYDELANLTRVLNRRAEYMRGRRCAVCGTTFHSYNNGAMYCSSKCRNRSRNRNKASSFRSYYRKRYGLLYKEYYDETITLKKLYERDHGICQICGGKCDWTDKTWGYSGPTYPSIDHIKPRVNGGAHKWYNVQLAHCICNSRKRDIDDCTAKLEMVRHAS